MSMTRIQRQEAKRASRIFYQTHCKECKCELDEHEIEYCDFCNELFENAAKPYRLLCRLFKDTDKELIIRVLSKVTDCYPDKIIYKLLYPATKDQIRRAISILKRITNK